MTINELGQLREAVIRLKWRVEELEKENAKLERAAHHNDWYLNALMKDVERLKKVVKKAGLSLPSLKSEAVPAIFPRRKSPNRQAVLKRDGPWCRYCGMKTDAHNRQIDHIVPVILGGTSDLDNLVMSCKNCNVRKGTKLLEECGMTLLPSQRMGAPAEVR